MMAETATAPSSVQLPPQTQGVGHMGQNGQGHPPHMAPPPLHIPQNTNPIPTAITSPLSGGEHGGMMSPSGSGNFRRAAPEPNKRALYVGGLDQRVTEEVLRQIFETTGHVQNVKIIPDKNVCLNFKVGASAVAPRKADTMSKKAKGFNYGFVEYDDPGAAERAMQTLNGRRVHLSVRFYPLSSAEAFSCRSPC